TQTTWFFWDGDALLGEVQQANDDEEAAPVWVGNVANLLEVKTRQRRLAALHERGREYVYYPGTFVPWALVGESQGCIRAAPMQDPVIAPDIASPQVKLVISKRKSDEALGVLGAGVMLGGGAPALSDQNS